MAYYVVFLRELGKYVVLPATWIKDIDKHYAKFINNSLNRSQPFLCFYTTSEAAYIDGRPDEKFVADFNSEYCFKGKLKRYVDQYADAVTFMNHLRNLEPAVYNHRRLNELPIPDLGQRMNESTAVNESTVVSNNSEESFVDENNDTIDQLSDSNVEPNNDANDEQSMNEVNDSDLMSNTDPLAISANENDQTPNEIQNDSSENVDHLENYGDNIDNNDSDSLNTTDHENELSSNNIRIVAVESLAISTNNEDGMGNEQPPNGSQNLSADCSVDLESDTQNCNLNSSSGACVVKNEFVPLFDLHTANNEAIDELLDEPEEFDYGDDLTMMVGPSGLPMPWASTEQKMIKRENDPMSGDIPFNEEKKGRIYRIDGNQILIPKKAVDKIIEWNSGAKREAEQFDKKICYSLLLSLVSNEHLQESIVSANVMEFIRGCFEIRCDGAQHRIDLIEKYKEELCAAKSKNKK